MRYSKWVYIGGWTIAMLILTLFSANLSTAVPRAAASTPGGSSLVTLQLSTEGDGTIERDPQGVGSGPFTYESGTVVTLTSHPGTGQIFAWWTLDDVFAGWANPLTITLDRDRDVQAVFAPSNAFDVPANHPAREAVIELAARGAILGYSATEFGADQGVQRAQMAALIARSTIAGPGIPTNGYLTPTACTRVGTWDCEDWGNTFTDRGGVPASLWRAAGTLQHYQVAFGYTQQDCANKGRAFPCYGPTDPVSYAQTIAFITRAMIAKGYWVSQPNAPLPYQGVPDVLAKEVRTFAYYTGGVPQPPSNWNGEATRGWFAQALWVTIDSYFGTEANLPDGRPAGGLVP